MIEGDETKTKQCVSIREFRFRTYVKEHFVDTIKMRYNKGFRVMVLEDDSGDSIVLQTDENDHIRYYSDEAYLCMPAKRCVSFEEYKLRQYVDERFVFSFPRYFNGHLHTIAVKDDTGEMIVFKMVDGKIIEIEV